jgi:ATP-dependent DNA helicase DinG
VVVLINFLNEAGLAGMAHVSTLEVESSFNYATQGKSIVVETVADPKNAEAYTREMVAELLLDLTQVKHGALALFTSRVQMKAAVDALS